MTHLIYIIIYLIVSHIPLGYFKNTHQVMVGLPLGVGGLAISFHLILCYFYNTLQVLVGLLWGWWPCYFVLF
jgi:uncharacterized membrane protein